MHRNKKGTVFRQCLRTGIGVCNNITYRETLPELDVEVPIGEGLFGGSEISIEEYVSAESAFYGGGRVDGGNDDLHMILDGNGCPCGYGSAACISSGHVLRVEKGNVEIAGSVGVGTWHDGFSAGKVVDDQANCFSCAGGKSIHGDLGRACIGCFRGNGGCIKCFARAIGGGGDMIAGGGIAFLTGCEGAGERHKEYDLFHVYDIRN